ncbi:hypothetical protein F1847_05780 [Thermodesulfobacterium sp. TA1]|uniref:hypothetical protein n=1 Tax=Thermodesulfobacterium sp. TA1 TaxID=2234087 RepID=UPI001232CFD1|nr:hypothetical protein [Thermodesulfobacterium sp. TA1]QER42273.1 hypothetical protein F1847_05780 [Thermodesulfobacterium sp. TA1]
MFKSFKIISFLIFINLIFSSNLFSYEDLTEKRLNLWPLIFFSKNHELNSTRIEALGPFYQEITFTQENSTSVRPIISKVNTPGEKKVFFLSPLGIYKTDNQTSTLKLVPIINKTWYKDEPQEAKEEQFTFFPFFKGKTASNETYGGFFPLYGKIKNRFGAEEITFFLWPLYSRTQYEEYTAYNILWPFIRKISANQKKDQVLYQGFKVWPFYGRFKEKEEERKFILWPFYIKETFRSAEGDFSEKLISFPFYIKEKNDTFEKTIVLWPFFQKITTPDQSYYQLDAPWPFFREIKGKDIEGKRFWPLYGYVKKAETFDYFILWPLYSYQHTSINYKDKTYYEEVQRFLFLSKFQKNLEGNQTVLQEVRIWPLFYKLSQGIPPDNIDIWYFPAILPIFDEGLERNYGPLLKLMEYYQKQDYVMFKFLWGLYRYERYKQRKVQELGPLLRIVEGEKTAYVEILEGLFGIGQKNGLPVLKILYIPIEKRP